MSVLSWCSCPEPVLANRCVFFPVKKWRDSPGCRSRATTGSHRRTNLCVRFHARHKISCQDRLRTTASRKEENTQTFAKTGSGQKQKHKKDSRSSGESALKARCFAAPYVPSENSELTWLTPETDGTCSFNSCNLRFCDFAIWFLSFGLVLLCEFLGSVIAFQSFLWLSFRLSV